MLILALLSATGTHWIMLQSVAWAAMLSENACQGSLHEAIDKTFDGNHPCPLCKAIAKGRQSENKSDLQNDSKRLEYFNQDFVLFIQSPSDFRLLGQADFSGALLNEAPPVPPPRTAVL